MELTRSLSKQGYVQIEHFLPYQSANRLRRQVLQANHFRTWMFLTTPTRPKLAADVTNKVVIEQRQRQAWAAQHRRKFAFVFHRSSNKHAGKHQNSDIYQDFCQQVQQYVGESLELSGHVTDCFLALFQRGHFIGYHADKGLGKYAFIYQLSKGWQQQYGGQLVLYPKQMKFYRKLLTPKFNTLTLLKLDHPMYHSVLPLTNPKHKPRISISGWLS